MIRIVAFTGGRTLASARFRIRQYIKPLAKLSCAVDEFAAPVGAYPPQSRWLRPVWAVAAVTSRLPAVVASHRYDISLLQRELVSTLPTLEFMTGRARILDIDDAIWLQQRAKACERIARRCDAVICGNPFIAEWARAHNRSVKVLPTAVDTDHFKPKATRPRSAEQIVIGWMGQSSGQPYLKTIGSALQYILKRYRNVVFRVVSDQPPKPCELPMGRVEFIPWSVDTEVNCIQNFDIGVMPMEPSAWSLGKCSYKMLLYMACGVPIVVSDFGMNSDVLKLGNSGLGAKNIDDWIQALESLIQTPALRGEMGVAGRRVVQDHYSLEVLAPRLAEMLGASRVTPSLERNALPV